MSSTPPRVVRIASPSSKSSVDLDDVRRKLEQLAAEDRVSDLIALVMELLVGLRNTNNALTVRLHNALRALYGRKSQKVSTEQLLLLFAELGYAFGEPHPCGWRGPGASSLACSREQRSDAGARAVAPGGARPRAART